jgi:mannose-6-phosphate isomerase-like protein (cupin superfamily)
MMCISAIFKSAIVVPVFSVATVLRGQQSAPRQIPDAVTADGAHYTVLYEDAEVRVLRIHYGPHEKGQMHNDPRSVTVFLTDGNLRMTLANGQSMVATVTAGRTVLEEAGPHQPENLSDRPFEAIRTEMKTAPLGAWSRSSNS